MEKKLKMKMINQNLFLNSAVFTFSLFTCLFPQNVKAATWEEVSNNLNQNAETINICLLNIQQKYENKQPETFKDFEKWNIEKLNKAHNCLSSIFQDFYKDTFVELEFKNTTFTSEVNISGKFSFDLSTLDQDNIISQSELKAFSLNNNLCENSNLKEFSYTLPETAKMKFELQYASSLISKIIEQNPTNQRTISLQNSLESLTKKDEMMTRSEYSMRQGELIRIKIENTLRSLIEEPPIPLPSLEISNSYITSLPDSSPQLQVECESKNGRLSVKNGLSIITFIQSKKSEDNTSSSGYSWSWATTSNSKTISYNDQTLTIKTRASNDSVITTYEKLPISVLLLKVLIDQG